MIQSAKQLLSLAKQLMPNGRAFTIPPQRGGTGDYITDEEGNLLTDEDGNFLVTEDYSPGYGGWLERLLKSFSGDGAGRQGTLERCYDDAHSILDHILPLPNNPYFTDGTINPADNDCNDYEVLFGLIQWGVTGPGTPTRLQRMAVIAAKMNYPGSAAPRQSAMYLQDSLQAAGFAVYVYENLSGLSPGSLSGSSFAVAASGYSQSGQVQSGQTSGGIISIIANHIKPEDDKKFIINNNHGLFFISGNPVNTPANIPAVLQSSFRQKVLQIKPAHMAAICFINFT